MEPSPTSTTPNEATNYSDPSSASSSSAATQQQLSTMSIGIIILCILFGLALIVLLLLFMRRRRLQRGEKAQQQEQHHQQPKRGGNGGGFKQRMKERLPWHHHGVAADEEQRIDDLVFSAIQQHPVPPSHPYHRPHHYHHQHPHQHQNHHHYESGKAANGQLQQQSSTMFEEGYSYTQSSTLRGTMTRTSHCSSGVAPPDTDPVLASLARQHEFDRAGYYKNPNVVSDRDEEEAMLQRLSMSSYHVW